jgi:predicted metal-dependent HD superfamily phosphohydrolase
MYDKVDKYIDEINILTWWLDICGDKREAFSTFIDIAEAYGRPHRKYHTFRHISECLEELDGIGDGAIFSATATMAVIYHDIVYNAGYRQNEAESALLALKAFERLNPWRVDSDLLRRMILASHHRGRVTDLDVQYFLDIDLAILGQSDERYGEYSQAIREEYSYVGDVEYAKGRVAFLDKLINRPGGIYYTDYFKSKYEIKARANMILERNVLEGTLTSES